MTAEIPVTLKWGKKTFELSITVGETASSFKQRVQEQTGVPVARQKLLAKKGWKGPLKDDAILDSLPSSPLAVTLIGSAETLKEPATKTKFLEDLTPEDLQKQEEAELQAAIGTATGMIQALQLPPHRRDDHKQELYQYNRLVTGLPQRQIEQELKHELQGRVAMTLGMELRRAYVNDLAVLEDGTCVSVLDDGHVQLWKHAAQQDDVVHPGQEGPVDGVVALHRGAFATAGRGSLQLWNADAQSVLTLPGAMPGTTPASLTTVLDGQDGVTCLAARFRVTRQPNPQQFRLPPQDANERQRRAQAEAQEAAVQQALDKASRSIQVWYGMANSNHLQTRILEPPSPESSAPITSLVSLSLADGTQVLIAGDTAGCLRVWQVQRGQGRSIDFVHEGLYRLGSASSVVCMEPMTNHRLAVSTASNTNPQAAAAVPISTPAGRAVHVLDFSTAVPTLQTSLTGHSDKDAVICMKQLPNGDLLTGGGKLDATLQLWSQSQLLPQTGEAPKVLSKAHKTLAEVGYVFSIAVLPDAKNDSDYFAVAVARYNTVKIII